MPTKHNLAADMNQWAHASGAIATGRVKAVDETAEPPLPEDRAQFTTAARPMSSIHNLLRLRPGNAPHFLCSRQRFGGGTFIDMLTASMLLMPLVAIPIAAQVTRWSWMMLICVPAAYVISVCRREFEREEWIARDLANATRTSEARESAVRVIPQTAPESDSGQFTYLGTPADTAFSGADHRT